MREENQEAARIYYVKSFFKLNFNKEEQAMKYVCQVCDYEYDEAAEGVKFEELPEDWVCPMCGVGKEEFQPQE